MIWLRVFRLIFDFDLKISNEYNTLKTMSRQHIKGLRKEKEIAENNKFDHKNAYQGCTSLYVFWEGDPLKPKQGDL